MIMGRGAVRAEIMALPEAERLPWAVELLEELLGDCSPELPAFMALGLSKQAARLMLLLNAAAPRWVPNDVLLNSINPDEAPCESHLNSVVCRMRKQGFKIESIWGYRRLVEPIRVDIKPPVILSRADRKVGPQPELINARQGAVWSKSEDADLAAMVFRGWCLAAMADELLRSERSIADRIRRLGLRP